MCACINWGCSRIMPDEDNKSRENNAIILLSDMYKEEALRERIMSGDNPVNFETIRKEMLMESGISRADYQNMTTRKEAIVLPENLILEHLKIGYNKGIALKEFLDKNPVQIPETGKEYDPNIIETQRKKELEKLIYGRYTEEYIKNIVDQNRKAEPAITVFIKPAPEDIEQKIESEVQATYTQQPNDIITDANPKFIDSEVPATYTKQPNKILTESPKPIDPEEELLHILEESNQQEEPPPPEQEVEQPKKRTVKIVRVVKKLK